MNQRRLISLLFAIFIPFQIIAQSWKDDFTLAVNTFKSGDYNSVISILENTIPRIQSEIGDSTHYCDAINLLAVSYVKTGNTNNAVIHFNRVIQACNQPGSSKRKNYVTAYINLVQVYVKLKDYPNAEKIYPEALALAKSTYGEKNATYISLWNAYPNIYIGQGKPSEAEAKFTELISLKTNLLGSKSIEVFHSTIQLGQLYLSLNQYSKAESQFFEIAKTRGDTSAPLLSKSYGLALSNLGEAYSNNQKPQKADSAYQIARTIFKNTLEEQKRSKEYIALMWKQANVWMLLQKFTLAERNYKIVLSSFSGASESSAEYISLLNNLASLYRKMGRMGEAEPLYVKAATLAKSKFSEGSPEYTNLLNNQGLLYDDMGNYEKAEKLYKEVLSLTEKTKGKEVVEYATTLNNLGLLYKNTGRLDESENAFSQALTLRKKILGSSHPEYGASCNNLASLLQSTGRLKEAEPLYNQSIVILRNSSGNKSLEYANSLNNLASLYEAQEMFAKALPLYQEALAIYREKLGERHPDYITTMNNLALLSEKQGDFKTAEKLFKDNAKKAFEELGKNHPSYATIMSNLGALYESRAMYKKADSLYSITLSVRKQTLGQRHPDYTLTRYNLARLYSGSKRYAEADSNWNISLSNYLTQIKTFFPSMSEKEKAEFYHLIRGKFENYNSYALLRYTTSPTVLSNMYNYQLETKALLLNASNKVRNRILNSNDTALISKYKLWNGLKGELSNYYSLSKSEISFQKINTDSLERVANQLEKELSLKSELFNKNTDTKTLKWQDIQLQLKANEAAVEIIRFNHYKFDSAGIFTDSVIYAALLIKKDTKNNPELILMPNGNELENKFLKVYRNSIRFKMEDNNSYAQFWGKIKDKLVGIEKVYVSPDGIYNMININALFNNETKKYAFEELEIQLLTNTKDLLSNEKTVYLTRNALIIGDPDFYLSESNNLPVTIEKLPGTREEVTQINALLTNNKLACNVYTDKKAGEGVLKSTDNPYILHIATHGFFDKDEEIKGDSKAKSSSNPLLRSGLLMAGSGVTLYQRKAKTPESINSSTSQEDGIFTAYEAMNMNLDKTELVILSACETGLGEIKNGEGVYGLQRALKIAGAKSIIISLWKVNDATTQKLMSTFYSELMSSNDKRKSFRVAQETVKKDFPHPYYWGAFMLIGN